MKLHTEVFAYFPFLIEPLQTFHLLYIQVILFTVRFSRFGLFPSKTILKSIMYVCITYVCVYICLRMYVCIVYVCTYVRMYYVRVYVYICLCIYVCIVCTYMCVCMCVCVTYVSKGKAIPVHAWTGPKISRS